MKRRPTLLDYAVNNVTASDNESTLRQVLTAEPDNKDSRIKPEGSEATNMQKKEG